VVKDGVPLSIDETLEISEQAVAAFGDADAVAEAYFETVGDFADNDEIDIVGHFDLITKFNEQKYLFDTDSPRYRAAARRAMERLVAAGKIFEINAGAMNRGYRTEPYPSRALLTELCRLGGKITINSDSHSPDNLCYGFAEAKALAVECGFTELWQYTDGAFRPQPL
jgi:histidinol-phosphatase (PHP family)